MAIITGIFLWTGRGLLWWNPIISSLIHLLTMAFGQLSLATGNQEYADIAKRTFDIVLSKVDNPKGKWNKLYPGTRNLKRICLAYDPL